MVRVFRGKIAIPGDQIEAYFEAWGQFENEKAPMPPSSNSVPVTLRVPWRNNIRPKQRVSIWGIVN
jgi:hypothetical protein